MACGHVDVGLGGGGGFLGPPHQPSNSNPTSETWQLLHGVALSLLLLEVVARARAQQTTTDPADGEHARLRPPSISSLSFPTLFVPASSPTGVMNDSVIHLCFALLDKQDNNCSLSLQQKHHLWSFLLGRYLYSF